MLEIKNVYKTFNAGTVNQKVALNGLDLKLEDGDFVTVIGGNGAGKSTMLNAIAGVWPIGPAAAASPERCGRAFPSRSATATGNWSRPWALAWKIA